jgi:spore maturation protein CgeB
MKIIFAVPGHLRTVPMNFFVYQTLMTMGHEVKLFNFGSKYLPYRIIKKLSKNLFDAILERNLKNLLDTYGPDIFLTIFGFDLRKGIIEYIKSRKIITICWWLNDPIQTQRSLAIAGFYDFYFTNARGNLKDYRQAGLKNVFYLPVGCYPAVHKKLLDTKKKYEVGFAGDWDPLREQILSELAQKFNIAIWGPWKEKLAKNSILQGCIRKNGFFTPEEMTRMFNESHIVLNIHKWFGKFTFGLNPRVFEAPGCGAFQLCDWKEELAEHYHPEKDLVVYNSLEELKEKMLFYLSNPQKAADIAQNGFLKTHREHTYLLRLTEMFDLCGLS